MASDSLLGNTRALRLQITPTVFIRRLGRLTEDVKNAFLCAMWRAVQKSGRRSAFDLLQKETPEFERGLRDYLSADISGSAAAVFRSIEHPLGPKLHAPITLTDDPARMAIAQTMQSIGEDLQRTFHLADIERVQEQIANLAEGGGVALASFVAGDLYGAIAKGLDAAELELLPKIQVPTWVVEFPQFLDIAREEFLLWFRLVRTCLAVAVLDGIPYEIVWGHPFTARCGRVVVTEKEGIYGNAGYWLAMEILKMALDLQSLREYEGLLAAATPDSWVGTYVSPSPSIAGPSQYPLPRKVNQLAFEPNQWRQHCKIFSCQIAEQGTSYAFEFPPIAEDVINDPKLVGPQDHMYARENAQRLIRFARTLWDRYRLDFKKKLEVDPATEKDPERREFDFRLTAASLQYGGAHPPHGAHRNGAMFDVVVRAVLPLHCKGQQEVSEEDDVREAMSRAGGAPDAGGRGTMPVGAEGSSLVLPASRQPQTAPTLFVEGPPLDSEDPKQMIQSRCRQWDYPKRKLTWMDGETKRDIAIEEVGMRVTQCILLSFPSQAILADWRTLRDATNGLIKRLGDMAKGQTDEESKRVIKYILEWLGEPAAQDAPGPPWLGRLSLLPGHHHHWHVSYLPVEVENPPDERERARGWIEAHLTEILAD